MAEPTLAPDELAAIDAWWRAANYLSVGQIYLMANPLLREPLRAEHVKPRLLGHWGTSPGLNLLYAHLNRLIRRPRRRPAVRRGTRSRRPGDVRQHLARGLLHRASGRPSPEDGDGMQRLFRQFSFPGGVPSHVAPETPGSIHEGGELGYALAHAYGAALDNPDLLVACVIGDGEAETGPLAASWHANKFLDPVTDGAVLPILHLNGWKIANPTVLARIGDDELDGAARGLRAPAVLRLRRRSRSACTRRWRRRSTTPTPTSAAIQREAREHGDVTERPRWPMIVLRTPKGWTGPHEVDGAAGRGHLARPPGAAGRDPRRIPSTSRRSSGGCGATGRRSSSTTTADRSRRSRALAPHGRPAHGRQPARQRRRAAARPAAARLPRLRRRVAAPGATTAEATRVLGALPRRGACA